MNLEYHVMPWTGDTWRVAKKDAQRASGIFPTKAEAIAMACARVRYRGIVWLHYRDGTIERKMEQW